mmetsp:Transcript_20015/g.46184  ORF Transcript_20015/g.46184 Transcript_20015/m.46184 type:complete len:284 (+) Transcript_20015:387-1238(+)
MTRCGSSKIARRCANTWGLNGGRSSSAARGAPLSRSRMRRPSRDACERLCCAPCASCALARSRGSSATWAVRGGFCLRAGRPSRPCVPSMLRSRSRRQRARTRRPATTRMRRRSRCCAGTRALSPRRARYAPRPLAAGCIGRALCSASARACHLSSTAAPRQACGGGGRRRRGGYVATASNSGQTRFGRLSVRGSKRASAQPSPLGRCKTRWQRRSAQPQQARLQRQTAAPPPAHKRGGEARRDTRSTMTIREARRMPVALGGRRAARGTRAREAAGSLRRRC